MNKTLVEINALSLSFDSREILSDVSLTINENEIVTVIGPNGAGKSSLIKVLAKLIRPTKYEQFEQRPGLTVAYVPQKLSLDPSMPIKASRFLSLTRSPKSYYREALTRVGAEHLWSKQMHTMSGGEIQRVLLARAIASAPDLLLLDEPLQGVDISGQIALYQLISDIRDEQRCAVVMVSHDLHLVMAQTDKVICLNKHVCCQGRPENVSKDPNYHALFGSVAAEQLAIYTHHHDHEHKLSGDLNSSSDECRHD